MRKTLALIVLALLTATPASAHLQPVWHRPALSLEPWPMQAVDNAFQRWMPRADTVLVACTKRGDYCEAQVSGWDWIDGVYDSDYSYIYPLHLRRLPGERAHVWCDYFVNAYTATGATAGTRSLNATVSIDRTPPAVHALATYSAHVIVNR